MERQENRKSMKYGFDVEVRSKIESELFTNNNILMKISEYLPLEELKKARRVNKLWYHAFSKRIFLKIRKPIKYHGLLLYHGETNMDLGMPYTNFEFFKWPKMNEVDGDNPAVPLFNMFNSVTTIRQLTLSRIQFSFLTLTQVLRIFSNSLEFLKLELIFDSTGSIEDCNKEINGLSMDHLKHLHLQCSTPHFQMDSIWKIQLFFKIIENSKTLTEFSFETSETTNLFLELMMFHKKPVNLAKMNYRNGKGTDGGLKYGATKLIQFSKEFIKPFQVNYYGTKFPSQAAEDVLKVFALYDERLSNLFEKSSEGIQLENVEMFGNHIRLRYPSMRLDKCLFHFPKLQKLILGDPEWSRDEAEIKMKKDLEKPTHKYIFEELKEINFGSNYFGLYPKAIKNFNCFPNLRRLEIVILDDEEDVLNIPAIFQNLTKLTELNIFSPELTISDTDITGISSKNIKKQIQENSFEFLNQLNPTKSHHGISKLTQLRRVHLKIKGGPTIISLFYGFRQLSHLKELTIQTLESSQFNFTEEIWMTDYWKIFFQGFEELDKFSVFEGKVNIFGHDKILDLCQIIPKLKLQRPSLSLLFNRARGPDYFGERLVASFASAFNSLLFA